MPAPYRTTDDLNNIFKLANDLTKQAAEQEQALLNLRITNAQHLLAIQKEYDQKRLSPDYAARNKITEQLIKRGYGKEVLAIEKAAEKKFDVWLTMHEKATDLEKADARKRIQEECDAQLAKDSEYLKLKRKLEEKSKKDAAKKDAELAKSTYGSLGNLIFGSLNGKTEELMDKLREQYPELTESELQQKITSTINDAKTEFKAEKVVAAINRTLSIVKTLENNIVDLGNARSAIDTRLQGSSNKTSSGSYWEQMTKDITKNINVSPFIKQATMVENLKKLVGQGIAFNVEQRAFLQTISEKIANTFDATDATLVKLVRIQQADTTAARLGMESALTAFLNNMYETSEYMQSAAQSIRTNIYEASALMTATDATAFEYQVQKWMGSLYSVGFNNAEALSGALGKLAAGDLSALNDNGFGNLLIMAANKANLSIAEILANGLDASETNSLMEAMVKYLASIYAETKNSKVVAQQFANVYDLTASDLKAAANLAPSIQNISQVNMNYSSMLTQLTNMANTIYKRTSTGEMLTNLWDNFLYNLSGSVASNPAMYAIYMAASLLENVTGSGIMLPDIKVMGSGVNLQTSVADLMRVVALSGATLSGIGQLLGGLNNGFNGANMLNAFGISSGLTQVSRGTGGGLLTTQNISTSESGKFVGNSDSSDIQNKTIGDANEEGQNQLVEAQEENDETKLKTVDEHVVAIYDILRNVTLGIDAIHIVEDKWRTS